MKNTVKLGILITACALIAIVLGGMALSWLGVIKTSNKFSINNQQSDNPDDADCGSAPAATYSSVNVFGTDSPDGTDYYKNNGEKATTTTLSAPSKGAQIQYWLSNGTNYCEPVTKTATCANNQVQIRCYANASTTLKMYDSGNARFLTENGGAYNVTLGASGKFNGKINYQGTAKYSAMPFGGCLAIEVPSSVASVSVNGAGISGSKACPYKWTYTASSTSNTYFTFEVPKGFDSDGLGDLKEISVQIQNGATDITTTTGRYTFQAADYYVTNDGSYALGIEKDKNQDTTKAGKGVGKFIFGMD